MKKNKACYCGSFDPITFGHEAIILAAAQMFDLTVLVAKNHSKKKALLSDDERINLVKISSPNNVVVDYLEEGSMLAHYCTKNNISIIVRGLRNINDLEYELQIAAVNADQCSAQTIFIPAPISLGHISSSMVKEVATLGGDISKYVNLHVKKALSKKITP